MPLWIYIIYKKCLKTYGEEDNSFLVLREKYLSLQAPIHQSKEFNVAMAEMYVYPVRGIRAAAQVDYLDLGMHGVKYDREILLAAKLDKAIVTTNKYNMMGCLR